MARYVPILGWLRTYRRSWLVPDAMAGLSVWALLVPQGIAYASIVGVPAQYGLYAGMLALLGYAAFGTSRQVVAGPSATVAAVSAVVVGALATARSPEYVALTAALAVTAGVAYALLGALRMGWVSNFLSKAVLGGFVFGFGIGLIIDQSHKILGVAKVEGSYVQVLLGTLRELPATSLPTLAVGAVALTALLLMRRFAPRWPRALVTVAGGIAAVSLFGLASLGVKVVGPVPLGLPSFTLPSLSAGDTGRLAIGALAVVFVGFSESLASAREMAEKHDYRIDASQEMLAQGAANAASGLFGGFVVDGSLSKTSVADLAGQRTQLASAFSAGFILLTLLFLAGLFSNLPEAVLGAVVIDAAIGLVKVKEFRLFRRASARDFAAYVAAMLGILFIGVLAGVLIGVVLSLLLLVSAVSKSPVRELAYDRGRQAFVRASEPQAEPYDHVVVAELDGPLFFADADAFRQHVLEIAEAAAEKPEVVVVDLGPTTLVDVDGAAALVKLHDELGKRGERLLLARVEEDLIPVLEKTGALATVGAANVFETVREAAAVAGGRSGGAT